MNLRVRTSGFLTFVRNKAARMKSKIFVKVSPDAPLKRATLATPAGAPMTNNRHADFSMMTQSHATVENLGFHGVDVELGLAIQVVSSELGMSEVEVAQQFQLLGALLPDLTAHLSCMTTADLVRLSGDIMEIAEKLLVLRKALPGANISRIVTGNASLLSMSKTELQRNLLEVKSMLAPYEPGWQSLLSEAPFLVEAAQLQATLSEIERTFDTRHTGSQPANMLGIMIGMGFGSAEWPSLDACELESDLLWL